jgi:Ca2+-binding EF-hand superfamily protein
MFVQGDSSGDRQLSKDEFETQMKRAGLAAEAADKLFKTFDSSDNGQLTVSEYVDGANDSIRAGNELFNRLMQSYTQDANGGMQKSAMDQFLKAGEDVASAYWKNAR